MTKISMPRFKRWLGLCIVIGCAALPACGGIGEPDSSSSSIASQTSSSSAATSGLSPTTGSAATTATATTTSIPSGYTISGVVSGTGDVSVALSGGASQSTDTNSSGNFSFTAVSSGNYTVTPRKTGYVFSPVSRAATLSATSVTDLSFSGTSSSAATYSISGTVSGSVVSGVVITLNGTNIGSTVTDLGGNYTFTGLVSGSYTVTASQSGYSFTGPLIVSVNQVDAAAENFTSAPATSGTLAFSAVGSLPPATLGNPYSSRVVQSIAGGAAPYRYESGGLATGSPPLGMIVNPNGDVTGTPNALGQYDFSVCATDASGMTSPCRATSLTVVAAPSNSPTPTPTPSPPTVAPAPGTSWVYYDGIFDWPGDYSFVATPDYTDISGDPLSGKYDIKVTLQSAYGGWLPYAQNWDFNSVGYTKLTFALKPTVANQTWSVFFVKVGDQPVGIYLNVANYGPTPVVGEWNTYSVPLSDLGVLGTPIYKFCIQDQTGLSNNVWYVDNVGFAP